MKKSEKTALGECFPRAFVILFYIFIFFNIADTDGGGAGMGADGDADGPDFIHYIEAFCQEGLAHFFYGGVAFLFPTHQQHAIVFLLAVDFVSCHIHDGFERFFMPAHLAFGIQFAIAHDDNRLNIQNRACQSGGFADSAALMEIIQRIDGEVDFCHIFLLIQNGKQFFHRIAGIAHAACFVDQKPLRACDTGTIQNDDFALG